MDPQFEELARRVAAEVVAQLSPKLVSEITTSVESSMEHRMTVHFERMDGLVKRSAEGYGATLDSIDRRLTRLEKKWDTRISDHDRALSNHNERISRLEQKRD